MEIAIRAIDPSVCLPYWDVTLDQRLPKATDSIMWSKLFMGAPDNENKFIVDGFFGQLSSGGKIRRDLGLNGRLFGEKEVLSMLTNSNMDFFFAFTNATPTSECTQTIPDVDSEGALELIHNYVHSWIGGQMTRLETSTEDPIFFVYHCFLDYIWEQWRQKWQNREQRETQYPPDDQIVPCSASENYRLSATMYPFQDPVLLIKAGLSNEYTDNLYTYATRPSCTETNGCGSPYLFCDLTKQQTPEPLCCAKIKPGGDCSIFQGNNEEPCFDSVCINGICTASEKGTTTEHGETTPQTETSSTTLGTTQLGETTATPTTGTSSTNIDTTLIGETTSTASDHFSTVFSLSPSLLTTEPTDQITLSTISSSTTLGTFTPNATVSSSYTQNPSCCCVCKECDDEEQYKMSFIAPNALNLEAKRKKHRKHKPRCGGRSSRKHRHHKSSSKSSSSSSSSSEEEDSNECDGKPTVVSVQFKKRVESAVTATTSSPQQSTKSTGDHLGSTTPSPTPPPPKKRICHDGHECCAHWAAKGACTSAPRHMNTWCSGTCRFNGCRPHPKQDKSGCKNLYSECHRWAHYHEKVAGTPNECQRNPHWMAQNCAKACQKCGATKPEQCIKNMPKDYQAPPIEYD
ncbi:hypothetical protein niasHT_019684 [Heterodera trifolii]|uniref:ShKT domain-containing protein n=1 Tax=Heterodera trifolii TaxID=157864 RepID=A0ABD2LJN0_9BILA